MTRQTIDMDTLLEACAAANVHYSQRAILEALQRPQVDWPIGLVNIITHLKNGGTPKQILNHSFGEAGLSELERRKERLRQMVLSAIERGCETCEHVCAQCGKDPATIRRMLNVLIYEGVLIKQAKGRALYYSLAPELQVAS